jgi:hypothetical protein
MQSLSCCALSSDPKQDGQKALTRKGERDWSRVYRHTDTDDAVARRLYDRYKTADDYVRYTVSLIE